MSGLELSEEEHEQEFLQEGGAVEIHKLGTSCMQPANLWSIF
ncbi:unnamed protein product [Calypogeia fissa]